MEQQKIPFPVTYKAYLNVLLDTRSGFPVMINAAIHSSPPGGLAGYGPNTIWANLAITEGASFQDAHDRAMDLTEYHPYAFLKPWLSKHISDVEGRMNLSPKMEAAVANMTAYSFAINWPPR